jgi:hypothetical protein
MTITFRNTFLDRLAFAAYHMPRNPLALIISIGAYLFFTLENVVPAVRSSPPKTPESIVIISFILMELFLAMLFAAFWAIITILSMISRRNKTMFCEKK